MPGKKYIAGVDVGGTNVRFAAVGEDFAASRSETIKTKDCSRGGETAEGIARSLELFIAGTDGECAAIAMGLPSTLSRDRRTVTSSPNVDGLDDVPLADMLERRFDVPAFLEKDACMLLFYDVHAYGIPTDGIIIGIYIGTGIGNAILIGGKPVIGKNGAACELGHVPSPGRDIKCSCGITGCAEEYAGGKALVRLCGREFPGTDIADAFAVHGEDPRLLEFVRDMAYPVAAEVNILDPERVIIGGGVVSMKGFPRGIFEKRVRELARKPYPASNLDIVFSENAAYGGALGAALYGWRRLAGAA
jgi:allose kinase